MKKAINTNKAPLPVGPYNQAVMVKNTLYISANIDYWWVPNISNNFQLKISKTQDVSLSFVVGLNIYYGKKLNL